MSDKTARPPRPPKKSEEKQPVPFTVDEFLAIGQKLAEANRDHEAAENEKKAVTKTLAAKVDGIAAKISELSGKLTSGFEYRDVTVETTYDDPAPGKKTTRRLDTGKTVRVEAMTLAEMQDELPLTDGKPAADPDFGDAITKGELGPSDGLVRVAEKMPEVDTTPRVTLPTSADGVVGTPADGDIFTLEDKNNP